MKVAIHKEGTWNKKVIEFCQTEEIEHKVLDFLHTDIVAELTDVTHVFWLYHHARPNDLAFASKILSVIESKGIKVFPDYHTRFHFDDKVTQKYLFEALNVDSPRSWVFYEEKDALAWAASIRVPIVAKLKGGAGSYNVRLLNSRNELKAYIKKSFRKGIKNYPSATTDLLSKTKLTRQQLGIKGLFSRAARIPAFLKVYRDKRKYSPVDIGYAYFQEFIPDNDHDVRVTIVGDKAWGFIRYVRENDFRASGSGNINFDPKKIPISLISKSFATVDRLKMQSCCIDWVYSATDDSFKLVEVSMGFVDDLVVQCGGYFDRNSQWHNDPTSGCLEAFKLMLQEKDNP